MMLIGWYDTLRFIGAAFGAALLWGILASAFKRRGSPSLPLLTLLGAVALWLSGEALKIIVGPTPAFGYAVLSARFGLATV
jgi:hypothetical protein